MSSRLSTLRDVEHPDLGELPGSLNFSQFVRLWNESQGRTTPALHEEVTRWFDEQWAAGNRRLLLMVFRDAGKSTLVGLFCAWLLTRDPDLRILVLAAEHQLACKMTRNVRQLLQFHPAAHHLTPTQIESWAADQLTVRRSKVQRDPSLLARGISANITGSRADVVVCDDVEVPNTTDTLHKRAELRDRLREINYILVPGGLQLYVGTPHTFYSIYADRPRPEVGEEQPFLASFARLVLPLLDEHGRSRWPERFTPDEIDRIRKDSGPAKFRSQMLLEPTRSEDMRLDPDRMVRYDDDVNVTTASGRTVLRIGGNRLASGIAAWDPAYGRLEGGDASAVAAVFIDTAGRYWLHDVEYLQVSAASDGDEASGMCRSVVAFAQRHGVPAISVEVNGIGKFLPSLLRREIERTGVKLIVQERTSSRSKDLRILEAFDPLLAARRLNAHARLWSSQFVQEMREWVPGRRCHDDGLDAVSACILAQPIRLNPASTRASGPTPPGFTGITDFHP